jgi:hypothetical protein
MRNNVWNNGFKEVELMKMGQSTSLINRFQEDGQLTYIRFDSYGNLYTELQFEIYRNSADDYFRFELKRCL